MTLADAIRHFGSKAAIARLLGITMDSVYGWRGPHVPFARQYALAAASLGALSVDHPRHGVCVLPYCSVPRHTCGLCESHYRMYRRERRLLHGSDSVLSPSRRMKRGVVKPSQLIAYPFYAKHVALQGNTRNQWAAIHGVTPQAISYRLAKFGDPSFVPSRKLTEAERVASEERSRQLARNRARNRSEQSRASKRSRDRVRSVEEASALSDNYLRRQLCRNAKLAGFSLKFPEIPINMIEAHRVYLQIVRHLREVS